MRSCISRLAIPASLAVAVLGSSCGKTTVPQLPPPKVCETAATCADIGTRNDKACALPFGYSRETIFIAGNNHPSRKIYLIRNLPQPAHAMSQ